MDGYITNKKAKSTISNPIEPALSDQLRILKLTLDESDDGIIILNRAKESKFYIQHINKTLAESLSTGDGTTGKELPHILPADIAGTIITRLEEAASTGKTIHFQTGITDKKGLSNLNCRAIPVLEGEECPNIILFSEYLTKIRNAEQELKESEELLRLYAEHSSVGMVLTDTEGKVLLWNRTTENLSGIPAKEAKGTPLWKLIAEVAPVEVPLEEKEARLKDTIQPLLKSDDPCWPGLSKDMGIKSRDGQSRTVRQEAFPINTSRGRCLASIITDVTHKRNAEERLRQEMEFNKTLIDTAQAIILVLDNDGRIVSYNKHLEKLSGHALKEMRGKDWFTTFLPQQDRRKIRQVFAKAITDIPTKGNINPIITKDGREVLIEWYDKTLKDKKGRITGILATGTDVTERLKAEQELGKSEEKYRLLYETSRDAIMTLEPPSWKFTSGNPSTISMFRAEDEKHFTSMALWELSPEYQPDGQKSVVKAKKMIEKAMRDGSNHFEWLHKNIDGEEFHATVLLTRFTKNGKDILQATVRDITQRKRVEDELSRSKQDFRNLVEEINDVIYTIDTQGKITYMSPRIKDLTGYEPYEVLGRSFTEFIHEEDLPALKASFKEMLQGKLYPSEFRVQTKKGLYTWVVSSSRRIIDGGKIKGIRGLLSSIQERKKSEIDKERMHEKAREHLIMIQKQNIQLLKLQKKLKNYSTRLEQKVKRLQKRKVDLTEKEQLVFHGITANPYMTDKELADTINLKRTTVTSIRNRLKREGWYRKINIPNLSVIGCGLITIMYGNLNIKPSALKKERQKLINPSIVYSFGTSSKFLALALSKDVVEFHQKFDTTINYALSNRLLSRYPDIVSFPLGISEVYNILDFSPLLAHIFKLKHKPIITPQKHRIPETKLNRNMKDLLYALVKYPEDTTNQLAGKLRLSRSTVGTIKNRLFTEGFVKTCILPDIRKLGCETLTLFHWKFASENPLQVRKAVNEFSGKVRNSVICISGTHDKVAIRLYKDYAEQSSMLDKERSSYRRKGISVDEPLIVQFSTDELNKTYTAFAPLTRAGLGIDKDI